MKLILSVFMIFYVLLVVLMLKNNNTYNNHTKILQAIHDYAVTENELISAMSLYDEMEDYDRTMFRLWDWGYTRILPPDKFELIKPYIKK